MRCDAGVMISASHNAYQDNGIKFFAKDGFKLPDEVEDQIERLIASGDLARLRCAPDRIGQARRIEDAQGRYVVMLKKTFPLELTLDGLRIVLDCANGAAYKVGPTVLEELGAEVFTLGVEPNGRNINDGVGSQHPEKLIERVHELRADLGIALDGDADRVVGWRQLLAGDALLAICARELASRDQLAGRAVVATVMSNLGLERALAAIGARLVRTQVGDRYVVEEMRRHGYNLGGEQSGHVIFLDHNHTGDGLLTAYRCSRSCAAAAAALGAGGRHQLHAGAAGLPVVEKRPLRSLAGFQRQLARVEASLGNHGRVLIRYSGTEQKARVMVEGEDEARVTQLAQELADGLKRALVGAAE
jgi:phosphoglucosamine mutase